MSIGAIDAQSASRGTDAPDDIEAYIADFNDDERRDLAAAEAAIDIAMLLYRAREQRGLSQTAAAKLAGLRQQTVSRFERPEVNPQLETVQAYLGALGYALELRAIDLATGETAAQAVLPPRPAAPRHRPLPAARGAR
jgi:DNA-binding XRE family transcriptional regulator